MAVENQSPETLNNLEPGQLVTLTTDELKKLVEDTASQIVEARLAGMNSLPPNVKRAPDGGLYREKSWDQEIEVVDLETHGTKWITEHRIQRRPVSLVWEDAQKFHMDFYHPTLGWVNEGYKLEKDRTPQDIMADTSTSIGISEDQIRSTVESLSAKRGS